MSEFEDYWRSSAADSWTCIPGRICGGSKMMKEAALLVADLRAALKDIMGYVDVDDFSAHDVTACRKSMDAAERLLTSRQLGAERIELSDSACP